MTAQDLKNTILQMAVRGKLVEQRFEEGSAEDLFKEILQEKINGLCKKEPLIADDEIPFDIPETWKWVRVNNIAVLYNGRAYSKEELKETGKYPVLRVGNLFTSHQWYYSDLELEEEKYCQAGDLLYAWSASFGPHIWDGGKVIYHYHIWKIVHSSHIFQKYLYYYLLADTERIKQSGHGLAMIHVTKAGTEQRLIPLPPIAEQQRVVARIEELMPLVEEYGNAEERLTTLNADFPDKLRKSILQQAIQGKLTERNPSDEPASELLKRISAEKARLIKEGKIKKEKTLPPITEEEIPFEIPENWAWVRIGEMFEVNPRNAVSDDMEVGFIPMPLLEPGFVNKHTFEKKIWKDVKKNFTHFQNGDVVFAKITPCFQNRKSAIICDLPNGYGAGTTELHVLRSYSGLILNEYALWFVKNERFIVDGVEHFTGSVGQQRVGTDFIKQYPFPLPPLAEQQRIVDRVNELLTVCDELK